MPPTPYHININGVELELLTNHCQLKVTFPSGANVTFDCTPMGAPGGLRKLDITRSTPGTHVGAGSKTWTPAAGGPINSQIYTFSSSESIEYLDPGPSGM
jgi:hypothetical protein